MLFVPKQRCRMGVELLSRLEIQNISYYYPENQFPALKNINLSLEDGEFLLLVGGTGSGKSSLARVLAGLIPNFYGGKFKGTILFNGKELREAVSQLLCSKVGMVFQDPEKQMVMTSVEAEIAFGLENLGLPQQEMFRRVAEVMSFLDLSHLKKEFTANLSGGQKQKVALAAVLAMQPSILILDEPTSQLDPLSAEEFLNLVERLNKELGYTVLLVEQRLERCIHLADRLVLMDKGEIICDKPTAEAVRWQVANKQPFIPPVAHFFALLDYPAIPLTIKGGRKTLQEIIASQPSPLDYHSSFCALPAPGKMNKDSRVTPILETKDIWFTYPIGREALKGVSLKVDPGDFAVIMGGNAAGKTTFLKLAAGLLKPDRGRVFVRGIDTRAAALPDLARHIGYLSQNPNEYLFQDTVEDELLFTIRNFGIEDKGVVESTLRKLGLEELSKINPRELSGGERQRVALASVLVSQPELLLLDEPTRGIDCVLKGELGILLKELNRQGMTIVMVTHDVEFAVEHASRIVLLFDGQIVSDGSSRQVLSGSLFYAPQMARLFKGLVDDVLTVGEAINLMNTGDEVLKLPKPR